MPPPPSRRRQAALARRRRRDVGRRRLAVLVLVALIALVVLLVTAFGGGGDRPTAATIATPAAFSPLPAGPPSPEAVARVDALTLELPINQGRVTAVGYFAASDGAVELTPIGTQANQGLLHRLVHAIFGGGSGSPHWYLLPGGSGPSTSALDVGSTPGTPVYSPVDGTIVGIEKVVLNGKVYGRRIDIQPLSAPSLVVSVSDIRANPSLAVGSPVNAGSSRLGVLLNLSGVERQELARYTSDAGNHVLIEVHPAASLDLG